MTDDEPLQLPVVVDVSLESFGSSTWMTDAGPVSGQPDVPVAANGCPQTAIADDGRCVARTGTSTDPAGTGIWAGVIAHWYRTIGACSQAAMVDNG